MAKWAIITGLFLSISTNAKIKKPNIETDLSIYGFNADSSQVAATKGGMRVGFLADGKVNRFLSYHGRMNFFFEEGAHSSLNNDSYKTATTYGVEEGYLKFMPIYFVDFKFGVMRSKNIHNPLFINQPAIGAKQSLRPVDHDYLTIEFFAKESILSTNSTQNRVGSLADRNPYYLLAGGRLDYHNDYLYFNFLAQSFQFERKSADVADKSRYRGANSHVVGTGESSRFTTEFSGHDMSGAIEFKQVFSGTRLYGQYIINNDSQDQGMLFGAWLKFFNNYGLRFESFENDATTLPAIVVNPLYGGTNRVGHHIQLGYHDKQYTMNFGHFSLDPVKTNAYQKQLKIVYFDLSTQF